MKFKITSLLIILIISLWGCNSKNRSDEVAGYSYQEEEVKLNEKLQQKLGDWVKEDVVCYGIVVQIDENSIPVFGKPVKAKIVSFQEDGIKMKALERVNVAKVESCTKQALSRGETWIEKEGDLFQTKEEAMDYLKKNNWLQH